MRLGRWLRGRRHVDPKQEAAEILSRALANRPASAHAKDPVDTKSFELYRETGENFRSVCVQISGDYFQMDTHDMGRATEEFWGDSDYEFWTVVGKPEWPKLLGALAKEAGGDGGISKPESWEELSGGEQAKLLIEVARVLFANDSRATDRLRDICDEHGVEASGGSWV